MKTRLLFVCLVLLPFLAWSQTKTVTGTLFDGVGDPIPFANIFVKGSTNGVDTDFDGNFAIETNVNDTLVFSYIGYATQEVVVTNQTEVLSITLAEDAALLEEVVVVGYGTTRKADLTGSISRLESKDLLKQPALTATQSLQGKAPGVQILASAKPGANPIIRIRGTGTVQAGRDPLFVVDGIITDNIANLNAEDIQNIDILKDASSLSIYGSRAANGAVIITTKKGRSGQMAIDLSSYYGIRQILKKVDMADASGFSQYSNRAFGTERFPTNPTTNTDWLDAITRTGTVLNTNLAVSGGNENVTAYLSGNYFKEEGILNGDDFERLVLRGRTDFNLTDRLTVGTGITVTSSKALPKPNSAFTTAYKQSPLMPVRYGSGDFAGRYGVSLDDQGARYNNVGNPVAALDLTNERNNQLVLQGNITTEYRISDLIKVNSRFGITNRTGKTYNYADQLASFLAADPSRTEADYASPNFNTLRISQSNFYHWTFDLFATFEKSFNKVHNLKAVVGTSTEQLQDEFFSSARSNVPNNFELYSLNLGDPTTAIAESQKGDLQRLRSYFARASYDFDKRYLVSATLRRDGSSKFQESGEFWGVFPSVGVAWVLSEEPFFGKVKHVDRIKIRAGWGQLGNQNVPLQAVTFQPGLGAVFGDGQNIATGSTITEIIDPNVGWEITEEFDIGVNFSMFNFKLTGEIDYYNRLNTNAIMGVSLPQAFGASNNVNTHAGKVRNEGIELSLSYNGKLTSDLGFTVGGNVTYNQNSLEEITNQFAFEQQGGGIGNGQVTKLLREGQPIGSFFLLDAIGLNEKGEFIYRDINNDGEIDNADRQFFGSIQPKYIMGANFGLNYKEWDLNVETFGRFGANVYNGKKAQRFGGENVEQSLVDNIYNANNRVNENPAPSNDVPLSSTYYLESGDFFRINAITLGFNPTFKGFRNIRVYVTAQNPFVFQRFSGFTSELPGSGNPLGDTGIELNAYPAVKTFMLGFNVNF